MATPNTLFAIIAVEHPADVEPKIAGMAPWQHWKLGEGQWLLAAPSSTTTKEISDRCGFIKPETEGFTGKGIVLRVDGYFGFYAPSLWEWIPAKLGADSGPKV